MSEPAIRLLIVAAIALIAVAVAAGVPRRRARAAERAPLDLSGFSGRVLLFSAAGCRRCDEARRVLARSGAEFVEVRHEDDPARFAAAGVGAVPLIVGRDSSGREVGRVAGRASRRRVRALLAASQGG